MPATYNVFVPMAVSDPATACCSGCPDPKPRTLYLNTANHGLKTLTYNNTTKNWPLNYTVSSDYCSDSASDPAHTSTSIHPAPCLIPANNAVTDTLPISVVVSCPDGTGKWVVTWSSKAEQTYHRWMGATLASGQCGGFSSETAAPPAVHAAVAGCGTSQSFPAPDAAAWTGVTSGFVYANPPDPGASTLSA